MTNTISKLERETGKAMLERATSLLPLLRQHADAIEDRKRLTPEVHQSLVEGRFYRMSMPAEFGGPDVTIPEIMRILETLAKGDASTAWSTWNPLGGPAMSAFIPHEGTREMFVPDDACIVSSVASMGRAVSVEGGYRVTGRWPFMSALPQATYAGGLCFVFDGDAQRMGTDGPVVVCPFVPIDELDVIENWDTTGLRGTGSHDVAFNDVFVPERRVADFSKPPRSDLEYIHYVHVDNAANLTCASIALGIAGAALDAFRKLAPTKKLPTGESLAESALGRFAVAEAAVTLDQARGHLYETAEMLADEMALGQFEHEKWFPRTALASMRAADAAIDVVSSIYRIAGSSAIRRGNVFDRCLRDIYTLGAHKQVSRVNLQLHGAAAFGSNN